jgi:hypothetical protein
MARCHPYTHGIHTHMAGRRVSRKARLTEGMTGVCVCCTVLCCAVLCCTVLCCAVLYCTVPGGAEVVVAHDLLGHTLREMLRSARQQPGNRQTPVSPCGRRVATSCLCQLDAERVRHRLSGGWLSGGSMFRIEHTPPYLPSIRDTPRARTDTHTGRLTAITVQCAACDR